MLMFVSSHKMTLFVPYLFCHHADIRVTSSSSVANLGQRFLAYSTAFNLCRKTQRIVDLDILMKSSNSVNVVDSRPHSH
jgi:hypothetical protein